MLPGIYVTSVDDVLSQVTAHGGPAATAPFPDGDLRVAACRDPAGNATGGWGTPGTRR